MHTNQVELGRRNAGLVMAGAAYLLTYILCGMHCHKVIVQEGVWELNWKESGPGDMSWGYPRKGSRG